MALWADASPLDGYSSVKDWLARKGLSPQLQGWDSAVRFHPHVPCDDGRLPALLLPLADPDGEVQALAVAPLGGDVFRITDLVGPAHGCAGILSPPRAECDLVAALDIADGWSLGRRAQAAGEAMGVVIAPTLAAFAGGPLEDAYGRIRLDMPQSDPARPPWTLPGPRQVYLAVRSDLKGALVRTRKFQGGTSDLRLEREAAADFYGALAAQAWRRAGANGVRILRPIPGRGGFHDFGGVA